MLRSGGRWKGCPVVYGPYHDLQSLEPMEPPGCVGADLLRPDRIERHVHRFGGFNAHEGPSLGSGRKRGACRHAIGTSRGGRTTKIHALSDDCGRPVAFVRRAIGGSSGPFYTTGLMRASRHLDGIEEPTAMQMAWAFVAAVAAVSDLGGAKPGDRIMIDALHPAAQMFEDKLGEGASADEAWEAAVNAGNAGAEATKTMKPRLGRASYLGIRAIGHPDGGAVAVRIWLKAIAGAI